MDQLYTVFGTMKAMIAKMNAAVQNSFVGRFFQLEERGTTMTIELNGAVATFMSMGKDNLPIPILPE